MRKNLYVSLLLVSSLRTIEWESKTPSWYDICELIDRHYWLPQFDVQLLEDIVEYIASVQYVCDVI